MSVRTDVVNLIVNVNGNDAQNKLNDLRKKAVDLTNSMKGLKKSTDEYKAKAAELEQVEASMTALKKQIGITALTQKELVAELNKLKALKGSVIPFSTEFRQLEKDIRAVENRLYQVRNGVQGFSAFMSKIKTEVKQFGVMVAGYFGIQALIGGTQQIIQGVGQMSDSLADIRRVAGLSKEEVNALNDSLEQLNTRSSVSSLREIAVVAGKLGVEKDNVLGFTEALDKLVVALGDELGDANEIAEQLGKIVTVFDGKITGENITQLGNAFVHLANSGASSAGFIADFDQRLSGVSKSAGIGLGAISGLGAGLEELGGRVESSSTAVQKIIFHIAGDIPAAAKVAGMSLQDFNQLFNTDATEAMLRYSEGLVKNKQGFAELVAAIGETGEDGARVIETMTKMGESAEYLRGRIDDGKRSIEEMGDINEAFALKNETLGAEIDKLGKRFYDMATSDVAQGFARGAIAAVNGLLDVLKELPAWLDRNKQALLLMLTGYTVLRIESAKTILLKAKEILLSKQAAIVTALETAAIKGITIAKAAWNVVTALLTLNMGKLRTAWVAFTAVMSTNVIGALVVALGAALLLLDKFRDRTVKLSQAAADAAAKTKLLADITKASNDTYTDSIVRMRQLRDGINSTSTSYEEKKKMLEELIRINPAFADTLRISKDGHLEGAQAIEVYIDALRRKARAEAAQSALVELEKERMKTVTDTKASIDQVVTNNRERVRQAYEQTGGGEKAMAIAASGYNTQAIGEINRLKNENQQKQSELNKREGYINQYIAQQGDVSSVPAPGGGKTTNFSIPTGGDDKKNKKSGGKSDADKELERLEKETADFYRDLEKLRHDYEVGQMDADQAELQRVSDKYKDLYERAKKLGIDVAAIDEAQGNEMAATMEKQAKEKLKKQNEDYYTDALQQNEDYHNEWRENLARAYADGEIKKEQYERELTAIDLAEQKARWEIAQGYSAVVDKAKKDEVKEHRRYEHEKTQATIAENEKRKQFADQEKLAKAKTNVLTQVKGSGGELAAKKALLDAQFALETENMDQTTEMYKLKEAERNEAIEELEQEHLRLRIDQYSQYAAQIGSAIESFITLANNKGEKQLAKEKKQNEEKKKSYKQQLDSKMISQNQYNLLVEAADKELDKKTKELQREQAKREKALRMYNAVIAVAQGVAASLAYGGPVGIAMAIATGIAGALQIAAISSAPLPELGRGDWVRSGDKHRDKSGGINAKIERDEAVMSAAAMTNDEVLSVTGTTAQITSALNNRKGGKAWAEGAKVVRMDAWRSDRAQVVNPNLPAIMAQGGRVVSMNQETVDNGQLTIDNGGRTNELLTQLIKAQQENTEEIRNMKTRLKADVSLKELEDKKRQYENAKKVSGFG